MSSVSPVDDPRHRVGEAAGLQREANVMLRLQPLGEVADHVQQHLVAIGNQQRALQRFEYLSCGDQIGRLGANGLGDGDQVGFMRF